MGVNKAFLKGGKGKARASMPSTAHKAAAQKAPAPAAAAPVKQPRTKIVPKRLNGTLTQWRGNFGWIKPDEPINHPAAAKRPGKVYVAHEDVEAEIAGVGHPVSFFAYVDHAGVGAMNVRPGKPGGKGAGVTAAAAPAAAAPPVQKTILKTPMQQQKPAAKAKVAAAKLGAKLLTISKKALAGKGAGKGAAGKGAAKQEDNTPVDRSQREQVHASPLVGVVTKLRGRAGWVRPEEPITREEDGKTMNEIFMLLEDVEGDEKPLIGAEVMFFLYKDQKGYGAEHCQVVTQGDGVPPPKAGGGASSDAGSEAGTTHKKKRGGKKNKAAKAAKPAEERGPSGPDLPRERFMKKKIQGEIIHFVPERFGWIRPTKPVEHEASEKQKGKIYFHPRDVTGEPEKGKTVVFHCYSDASGLGAEEIIVR